MVLDIESMLTRLDGALEKEKRWLWALLALAFLLKLIFLIQSCDALEMQVPILDSRYYDQLARSVATGRLIQREAFFMAPLYPYFLGFLYAVFGPNLVLVRLVQFVGGTVSVYMTYLLGGLLFRPSVGFAAAAVVAFYGPMTFYEGQLLMMWLGCLINLTMLYVLVRGGKGHIPLAGFLLGISSLGRANVLLFAPVAVVWIFVSGRYRRPWSHSLLFLITMVVAIMPLTLHNYIASGDFVFTTYNGGMNFYIGNNPEASGAFYEPENIDFVTEPTTRRYVERLLGREMKPSEVSRYWLTRALTFIKENPGREAKLILRKALLFFNGYEIPQLESFDLAQERFGVLRIQGVRFWWISALALLGLFYSLPRSKRLLLPIGFVATYSFSIIIFFVTARYRMQLVPLLALFASYFCLGILPQEVRRSAPRAIPLFLVFLSFYATRPGIFRPDRRLLLWRQEIHRGRRLAEVGRFQEAIATLDKVVGLRPRDPESFLQRAVVYRRAGKRFQAIEDYNRALKLNPRSPMIHFELAQVLREARMFSIAAEEYLRTLELDSLMVEAYNNLGITYRELGKLDTAVVFFRKAIALDPGYLKAYNNMGSALAETGQLDQAVEYFRRAIAIDPSYASSYRNLTMALIEKKDYAGADEALARYRELRPEDEWGKQVGEALNSYLQSDTSRTGD